MFSGIRLAPLLLLASGMFCAGRLPFTLIAAVALGCGASQSAREPEPVVVWIGADEALDQTVSEALRAATPAGGEQDCSFFWGDVPRPGAAAQRARFVWGGGAGSLDGIVLCGPLADAALGGPGIERVVLYWRAGQLVAADPEGLSGKPEGTPLEDARLPPGRTVAVFEGDSSDEEARAAVVLQELSGVTDELAFAVWPLR